MTSRAAVLHGTVLSIILVAAPPAIADPRFACTPARPAPGTFHQLRIAGATDVSPKAINDRGDIVGSYTDAQGNVNGFLLRHGTVTTIHVPNSSTTLAADINNSGAIAGGFDGHGFLLRDGQFTMIDAPGAFESQATALNDRGVVVGLALEPNGSDGREVGFVRRPDGTFRRIVPDGAASALVADINNRGTLLVNADQDQLLRINGQYETIVPCEPSDAVTRIVRHRGLVGTTEDQSLHMFIGLARTAKGMLTYRYPESDSTIVRDRNVFGVTVGEATVPVQGTIGFVFIPR
jgi:hypothetical protein